MQITAKTAIKNHAFDHVAIKETFVNCIKVFAHIT